MREIQSMDARGRKLWKIDFSNGNQKKGNEGISKSNRFRIRQRTKVQPLKLDTLLNLNSHFSILI